MVLAAAASVSTRVCGIRMSPSAGTVTFTFLLLTLASDRARRRDTCDAATPPLGVVQTALAQFRNHDRPNHLDRNQIMLFEEVEIGTGIVARGEREAET